MKAGYGAAFESARGKRGAAAAFDRVAALTEISGKVQQPGGDQLDLVGLYKGALGAVGELWAYGQQAIAASGEAGVAASWGIKKVRAPSRCRALSLAPTSSALASGTPEPGRASTLLPHPCTHSPHANQACRIWFKLHTKYGGDVSKVTDCARISLEFATAEGLERAANFVLQSASTFKNRVANPTDEGYRDLMFTVPIEGHVLSLIHI